jgi:hypothetical protein
VPVSAAAGLAGGGPVRSSMLKFEPSAVRSASAWLVRTVALFGTGMRSSRR